MGEDPRTPGPAERPHHASKLRCLSLGALGGGIPPAVAAFVKTGIFDPWRTGLIAPVYLARLKRGQ
jgi:hypothetical protein